VNLRKAHEKIEKIHTMGLLVGNPTRDFILYVDIEKGPLSDQVITKMIKQGVPFMVDPNNYDCAGNMMRIWVEEEDMQSLYGVNYSIIADT